MPRIRQDNDNRYALRTSFVDDNGDVITGDTITISDHTTAGYLQNVVEDTTPQLGGTLDGNGFNFNGAVGFEANAGESLSRGDAVYVSGVSGNKPVVMKADADDAAKMPAFGIAENDANLNANVEVITFGTVYNVDTSAYSVGDELYVSTTPGALTATPPTGESAKLQNLGKVIRSHATAGSIKVGGAGRTNAVPNLNDGNVFIGDSNNQAEQRALVEADISDFGTYLTAESDTLDSVTDRGATTTNAITVGGLTSTGNVILDEATPRLDFTDTQVADSLFSFQHTGSTMYIRARGGTSAYGDIRFQRSDDGSTNLHTFRINSNGDAMFYDDDGSTVGMRWDASVSRVGIGISSPAKTIDIQSNAPSIRFRDTSATTTIHDLQTTGSNGHLFNLVMDVGNAGTSPAFLIKNYTTELLRLTSAGKLGISTGSPASMLQVGHATTVDSNAYITFGKRVTSAESNLPFIGHDDYTGNGASNDLGLGTRSSSGTINFYTGNTTAFNSSNRRMSIESNGNVTIANDVDINGNLDAGDSTDISMSSSSAGQIRITGNAYQGAIALDATAMHIYHNSSIRDIVFGTNETEQMRLGTNGDLDVSGGLNVGGSTIGSRANSISVVGDNNSSTIASKVSAYDTVFSVLPWASSITYLGTGTYYDDGNWIHASDNTTSSLLALSGSGVHWYASSGSTANFDVASNVPLWNSSGQWDGDINTTFDINTGAIASGKVTVTTASTTGLEIDSSGSSSYLYINGPVGNTWFGQNASGEAAIWSSGSVEALTLDSSGNASIAGTVTTPSLTTETASGPAIYIKDTSGTGATNHNSWISFRDSANTELGYVGYGSGGDANLSLSNYYNGNVNIQGNKATVITSTGYIDIGSLNTSHAHFYTDRGSYYFNKLTYIDGSGLRGYDSSTDCRFPLYYDLNDTSYYCDPASTSRLNVSYNNETSHISEHGRGVKFWNSDSYKIYMSAISNSTWGGDVSGSNASDYAMYFRMTGGTNRGFIFRNGTTNVAKIDGNGVLSASGVFGTSQYLDVKYNASGAGGVRLYDSDSTLQGYWYANGSGEHGLLDNDGHWAVRIRTGTNQLRLQTNNNNELMVYTSYVRAVGSCRSPLFYDMNNTSYYAHLDSTGDSIRAAGDIVAYYSDERLKDIEGPIENALDKVATLNGFYYRGNKKAQKLGYDDKLKVGLSAQEVQKVLPEVIKSCPADNQYMTLDYSKVVPLLVEAIKELKSEIEELKK